MRPHTRSKMKLVQQVKHTVQRNNVGTRAALLLFISCTVGHVMHHDVFLCQCVSYMMLHTLPLSVFSCLKCSNPSLVASLKTSDKESLLEPESKDDLSTACEGLKQNSIKKIKHLEMFY